MRTETDIKALKNNEAIDVCAEPEKTKDIIEKEIGYMRDGFNNVDVVIDDFMDKFKKEGVMFYADLNFTLYKYQMINLSKYLKNILMKFKEELKTQQKEYKLHRCITGNSGKCIECNQ